jgi:hypothetical protein
MHNSIPTHLFDTRTFTLLFAARLSRRCWGALCRWQWLNHRRARLLDSYDLILALVFHALQSHGTLAEDVKAITNIDISDAALAQRRARLPFALFEQILAKVLRPLADPTLHPYSFYRGKRLVGIDGSMFSVFNTPGITRDLRKALARRAKAAYAKLQVCVLVELAMHNPLAARVSRSDRGELTLAYDLLKDLPAESLLLADRLYGVGKFLVAFLSRFASGGSDFLVRVSRRTKGKLLERLSDGSVIVSVLGRDEQGRKQEILVRQICGVVSKAGCGRRTVRLWTSLLDERMYPAHELLALYARRWEQELAYRECKTHLNGGDLLGSYTEQTTKQEIVALLVGQSFVAQARLAVADEGNVELTRISFVRVLQELRWVWLLYARLGALMSKPQDRAIVQAIMDVLKEQATAKRRGRSVPRQKRQTVSSWPRKTRNRSYKGEATYRISKKHMGLS